MNNKTSFAIGGIIVGLVLGFFISPMLWSGSMMFGGNGPAFSGVSRGGVSQIDRHFIEQMLPHHDGAIAMANLALEKAKRPEVKTLAKAIISAQESENQQMKSWYKDWFGREVPRGSAMTGGMMSQGGMHMGGTQDIEALKNAPDFDKAFIEAMIPHHQMAIMMAQMLEAGTVRPEMKQLAQNIISSQTKEIKQMQGWYGSWYK
mgnify:CR=1 FL=1